MTVATVGAHSMDAVATSPHNNGGLPDIIHLLLLAPTVATGALTSKARLLLCGARGTCTVATGSHSNDALTDIIGLLLLATTVARGVLTSMTHHYWPP
jgi:hypothetical protein